MDKFIIPPDQSGYSVTDGTETLSVSLDGGAARYRKDILNSSSQVSVQWTLSREQYDYFRVFYKLVTVSGALPFLLDLYVDESFELTEHECHFVPGTVGLKSQAGLTFVVGATLEIKPVPISESTIDQAAMYGLFGDQWATYEDLVDLIVNTYTPNDSKYTPSNIVGVFSRTDWQGKQRLYSTSRTNYLTRSQEFSVSPWSGGTRTDNQIASPYGTITAALFKASSGSYGGLLRQYFTYTAGTFTGSVYVKKNNCSYVGINMAGKYLSVNLDTGISIATNLTSGFYSITALSDGWYCLSVTGIVSAGSSVFDAYITNATGANGSITTAGTETMYIWGAGLYNKDGSYIPTTSSAVTVTDYTLDAYNNIQLAATTNPITATALSLGNGLQTAWTLATPNGSTPTVSNVWVTDWQGTQHLYPTARKNVCLYSQALASWSASNAPTIASGAKVVGQLSLDLVGDTSATLPAAYYRAIVFTVDGDKAISFFVAQGTSLTTLFRVYDITAGINKIRSTVTWSGGAPVVTLAEGTLEGVDSIGSGIYRVRVKAKGIVAANTNRVYVYPASNSSVLSDATGDVYFGGVHCSDNAIGGSYILTTSAAVTVTDYTVSGNTLTFSAPPLSGAIPEWDGMYQGGLNGTLTWTGTYSKNNATQSVSDKPIATETGVKSRFPIIFNDLPVGI